VTQILNKKQIDYLTPFFPLSILMERGIREETEEVKSLALWEKSSLDVGCSLLFVLTTKH
jgi:hypothetical protein